MKLEQYWIEIQYVIKVFHAIYKKFLTAIDHINYHPSQMQNTTRVKMSDIYILEDSGSAENKEILLFSHDKLLLASILRLLYQVTKEMLV